IDDDEVPAGKPAERANGVGDLVRPDLQRIPVPDLESRFDTRLQHEGLESEILAEAVPQRPHRIRHHGADARQIDLRGIDSVFAQRRAQKRAELIRRSPHARRPPEGRLQLLAVEYPAENLAIPNIQRQKHKYRAFDGLPQLLRYRPTLPHGRVSD